MCGLNAANCPKSKGLDVYVSLNNAHCMLHLTKLTSYISSSQSRCRQTTTSTSRQRAPPVEYPPHTNHQLHAASLCSGCLLQASGGTAECVCIWWGMNSTVQVSKHQEAKRSSPPESRTANTENVVQRPCFTLLSPLTLMCFSPLAFYY